MDDLCWGKFRHHRCTTLPSNSQRSCDWASIKCESERPFQCDASAMGIYAKRMGEKRNKENQSKNRKTKKINRETSERFCLICVGIPAAYSICLHSVMACLVRIRTLAATYSIKSSHAICSLFSLAHVTPSICSSHSNLELSNEWYISKPKPSNNRTVTVLLIFLSWECISKWN